MDIIQSFTLVEIGSICLILILIRLINNSEKIGVQIELIQSFADRITTLTHKKALERAQNGYSIFGNTKSEPSRK